MDLKKKDKIVITLLTNSRQILSIAKAPQTTNSLYWESQPSIVSVCWCEIKSPDSQRRHIPLMCDIWVLPHACVNKAFVGEGGWDWWWGCGSKCNLIGWEWKGVWGRSPGSTDEIWSGRPDLFTRFRVAPSASAPWDPAGAQRAYFSAKTVQNITDCFFNAPLWYLRRSGAVSSVSPATAIGVMGFCCWVTGHHGEK